MLGAYLFCNDEEEFVKWLEETVAVSHSRTMKCLRSLRKWYQKCLLMFDTSDDESVEAEKKKKKKKYLEHRGDADSSAFNVPTSTILLSPANSAKGAPVPNTATSGRSGLDVPPPGRVSKKSLSSGMASKLIANTNAAANKPLAQSFNQAFYVDTDGRAKPINAFGRNMRELIEFVRIILGNKPLTELSGIDSKAAHTFEKKNIKLVCLRTEH